MNGPHDLGGAHGFGPVAPEPDEPNFHAEWERRTFGLVLAMGAAGAWNIDISRHARERIPPAEYLAASYFEKWLKGIERLIVERGLATPAELAKGRRLSEPALLPRKPSAENVPAMLAAGSSYERPPPAPARFQVGDAVRPKLMNPTGHTRLPRYLRGRAGRIARVHGAHVFPDKNAHGGGEDPQWLYSVAFAASEVWGPEASFGDEVLADLWEPYLSRPEPAEAARFAAIPRGDGGEVFPAPWAARAFALTTALQERGVFSASEWSELLGAEFARQSDPYGADPKAYWRAWLAALESMLRRKGVAESDNLLALREAWRRAAAATPQGEPIELGGLRRS